MDYGTSLHRNERTFLTLEQTNVDKRHDMPFIKTYDYKGAFIDSDHELLAQRRHSTGMIDLGIDGWLLPADAWKLYELAYHCKGNVLELGTYRGLSGAVICAGLQAANNTGHLISVDLDPLAPQAATANLKGRPGGERAHFFVVEGTQAIMDQAAAKKSYSFAFVDHSHSYNHVLSSCKALHRVIPLGGFALFHDYNDPRNAAQSAPDYGVYQGVMDGLEPRLWEFWGIFGCSGLFRRVGA